MQYFRPALFSTVNVSYVSVLSYSSCEVFKICVVLYSSISMHTHAETKLKHFRGVKRNPLSLSLHCPAFPWAEWWWRRRRGRRRRQCSSSSFFARSSYILYTSTIQLCFTLILLRPLLSLLSSTQLAKPYSCPYCVVVVALHVRPSVVHVWMSS